MPPTLSVVVVSINGAEVLTRCLAALVPQLNAGDVEILVVGHWDDPRCRDWLGARFPGVTWLAAPPRAAVPQMRAHGLKASRGDVVALLEDDCIVSRTWCSAVRDAHQAASLAIGGPIEPGAHYTALDWAVYLSEYGRFMAPFAGAVAALPGNNVSYKRTVLPELADGRGFEEVFFHAILQRSGTVLLAASDLAVVNVNHWAVAHVTTTPFHHGRAFAGHRAETFSAWKRCLYGTLSIALPPVKLARVAREVLRRRRHGRAFLRSLHWQALFMLSWSLGECKGYLFGVGDSPSRWR